MSLEIRHETLTPGALGEHGRICIAFVVDRILEVTLADGGFGGMSLAETRVADPYVKDYDAIAGAAFGVLDVPGQLGDAVQVGSGDGNAGVGGDEVSRRDGHLTDEHRLLQRDTAHRR